MTCPAQKLHRGATRIYCLGDIAPPPSRGEREVERAYSGGLGAIPKVESRGKAPGQRVKRRSPPEAESIFKNQVSNSAL